ncbi:MAG TPA: ABC transporter permease [Lacipirellulaceae bacterium]|nr:ABC transporter permease [Lacipirellulaceae bacterium]
MNHAAQQPGTSLTRDAWRRLRRDRAAMVALGTLALVGLLAALTPLLPLQPPDRDHTDQQYAPPAASPLWLTDFKLDEALLAAAPAEAARLRAELPPLEAAYRTASPEQAGAALDALQRKLTEIGDTVQAPYARAGFAELGAVSRWMVRTRYAVFGGWQLNSLCGRDLLGRDLLSRIFWGARVSIIVGVVAALVSLVIGVSYGAIAGYLGGWVDNLMMRVVDILYSIPFIFVVIFLITVLQEDSVARRLRFYGISKITVFYLVVGAIYWLTMARVVRGQVISLKTEPFVEAARSLGAGRRRIILRHLLPNLFSIVLVYLTLTVPRVILFESFLSYFGLGVEPPDVSWGLLAKEGIEVLTPVRVYWWLVAFPSAALGTTLLALNFLGDGLRDALDPRLQGR